MDKELYRLIAEGLKEMGLISEAELRRLEGLIAEENIPPARSVGEPADGKTEWQGGGLSVGERNI